MSDMQPMDNFWEEWNMDPMLSSGQQLYASGATVSGPVEFAPSVATRLLATSPLPFLCNTNQPNTIEDLHDGDRGLELGPLNADINTFNNHVCYTCFTSYKRLGDLTRHQREKHGNSSAKYLCPIERCPKGIKGNGFNRMHHLVEHLKRGKHNMNGKDAVHLAHKHNVSKPKTDRHGIEQEADKE